MVGEIFQIYGAQITGKCICESYKIERRTFHSCPLGKTLPHILIITPQAEGNYSFYPK